MLLQLLLVTATITTIVLKLNQDKSKLVIFTSKFRDEPVLDHVEIIEEKIKPV